MQIRANNIIDMQKMLLEKYGLLKLDEARAMLSESDIEEVFNPNNTGLGWMDFGAYLRYLKALDDVIGTGDTQFIKELTCFNTMASITTIHKVFFKILKPSYVISKSYSLFKANYQPLKMGLEHLSPTHIVGRLSSYTEVPEYHEIEIGASVECVMNYLKVKNISVKHIECQNDNHQHCIYDVQWDES